MAELSTICSSDIVVDTDVLCHSCNPGVPQHSASLSVVEWLEESETVRWVLDDQGKAQPELSTSVLASQYQATLPPQSFAMVVFMHFLASGRIAFSDRPSRRDRERIQRLVPRNKTDQAVMGAALGSVDKVLISNDTDDFSPEVRSDAKATLGILILEAIEVAA